MEAVSPELYDLFVELQSLDSLALFALAGGTSLALRFDHRVSVDIDLFSNQVVGIAGLKRVEQELKNIYKDDLRFCTLINTDSRDQYCFLRALIHKRGRDIKVEVLQNIQLLYPLEAFKKVRIVSTADVGLLKLMSASNRRAKKDIYDLDQITDTIALSELLKALEAKAGKYSGEQYKCLFDLDEEASPVGDLHLLLAFDHIDYTLSSSRPSHSNDHIDIVQGNKSWSIAKASWRRKVHQVFKERGIPLPPIKPIN